MAKKRERLEVIHDILATVRDNRNNIKPTRLLRFSNLSSQMFNDYMRELLEKEFLIEHIDKDERKNYSLSQKGFEFLEKYKTILEFVNSFGL